MAYHEKQYLVRFATVQINCCQNTHNETQQHDHEHTAKGISKLSHWPSIFLKFLYQSQKIQNQNLVPLNKMKNYSFSKFYLLLMMTIIFNVVQSSP